MAGSRMSDAEYQDVRVDFRNQLVTNKLNAEVLQGLIAEFSSKLTSKQFAELVLDAMLFAVKDTGLIIRTFINLHNKGINLEIVSQSGDFFLADIPDKDKDYDIYLAAVKRDGMVLQQVPANFQDDAMYEAALSSNGLALEFIPEEKRSQRFCEIAANQNIKALQFVSPAYQTEELCLQLIDNYGYDAFDEIDEEKITPAIYLKILDDDLGVLKGAPDKLFTYEFCQSAIRVNPLALQHIKRNFLKPDEYVAVARLAIQKDFSALKFVYPDYHAELVYQNPLELKISKYLTFIETWMTRRRHSL